MSNDNVNTVRRLVIRVSRESLTFSTTEKSEVAYEAYPLNSSISMAANLREALRTSELLGKTYGKVLVMLGSPVLTIPTSLFREEEQEKLYRFTFTDQEQTVVMHTVLPDLNCVAIFSVQKDLLTVISDAFQQVRFIPVAAPVWHHLHQRSYTGTHKKLYTYFHDRQMEVFCFTQNRFRFSNSFAVNNPNDALYYLLGVWKQLALDPSYDELYLSGDMREIEPLLTETQKFIKHVFVVNPSGEFNHAAITQIKDIPYDLVTLYMKGL